jgi:hypothetical protein
MNLRQEGVLKDLGSRRAWLKRERSIDGFSMTIRGIMRRSQHTGPPYL